MNVQALDKQAIVARRTTADDIFDEVYVQISTLKFLPGTKLSDVEIAKHFGVSRQPVRDAFIRLSNMGLLLIRPQRATEVSKISLQAVATARFTRLSMEIEIARRACNNFQSDHEKAFLENLEQQNQLICSGDLVGFGAMDSKFHELFCIAADLPHVFPTIAEQKSKVDRLCALSLADKTECEDVLEDHKQLVHFLTNKDQEGLDKRMRRHLSRLDSTIESISKTHAHFFG